MSSIRRQVASDPNVPCLGTRASPTELKGDWRLILEMIRSHHSQSNQEVHSQRARRTVEYRPLKDTRGEKGISSENFGVCTPGHLLSL